MTQPSQSPALPPSLQLIPNITVTIDGDDYVVTNLVTGEIVLREPFGPEYAGEITIKPPRIADDFEVSCIVTAATQRFGVIEPGGLPADTYKLIAALAWFQVLGVKRPDWLSEGVASSPKGIAAIIRAHAATQEKLAAAKKASAGAGASSSSGS